MHRSVILVYHEKPDEILVGQHLVFTSLTPRIFYSRWHQPKNIFVWDVQVILNFIKKHWGISSSLIDLELTYKLFMLLSLTTASRVSGLQHLDIRYMTKGNNKVTFFFLETNKSWCKGKPLTSLTIIGSPEDPQLCVIETLDTCRDRTKDTRLGKSELLWSF